MTSPSPRGHQCLISRGGGGINIVTYKRHKRRGMTGGRRHDVVICGGTALCLRRALGSRLSFHARLSPSHCRFFHFLLLSGSYILFMVLHRTYRCVTRTAPRTDYDARAVLFAVVYFLHTLHLSASCNNSALTSLTPPASLAARTRATPHLAVPHF